MIHGLAIRMGKSQRFPVGFPPVIREIIKQQVGILGSSESEVVKNIVLIYFTEKGHLKSLRTERKRQGGI
jgi:hypothetical protein